MIISSGRALVQINDSAPQLRVIDLAVVPGRLLAQQSLSRPFLMDANETMIVVTSDTPLHPDGSYGLSVWDWSFTHYHHVAVSVPDPSAIIWPQTLAVDLHRRWMIAALYVGYLSVIDMHHDRIMHVQAPGEYVSDCVFAPRQPLLAVAYSGQGGGGVLLYAEHQGTWSQRRLIAAPTVQSPCDGLADTVMCLRFSPDGHNLAVYQTILGGSSADMVGWQGDLWIYDCLTHRVRWAQRIPTDPSPLPRTMPDGYYDTLATIAFSPQGTILWCGHCSGAIRAYAVDTGVVTHQYDTHRTALPDFGVDPVTGHLWVWRAGELHRIR